MNKEYILELDFNMQTTEMEAGHIFAMGLDYFPNT